jgi:putative ABC transport system permease protein
MLYRMKQNAVGLANICILSTMVLVMLSCTVSMYFGVEDELDYRYPTEISVVAYYTGAVPEDNGLYDTTVSAVKEAGGIMTSASSMDTFGVVAYLNGTEIVLERQSVDAAASLETMYLVNFCTAEDYEAMTGENVALLPGEIAVAFAPFYGENEITIGSKTYAVKENLSYEKLEYYMITGGEGYVITGDKETFYSIYHELDEYYQNASAYAFTINQEIAVDLAGTTEEKLAVEKKVGAAVTAWKDTEHEKYEKADSGISFDSVDYETKQENRESFYSLYGSLFFLGLFLGILFLMITVLIIFYKQISEGYEDRERFAIMEKVGMSSAEVKASINSQIRLVFFLPLVTAAIHLAAAFPMLKRILAMLNLTNTALFVWCLAGTVVVFGVIYFIVFAATSKTYYRIVGNQA